MRLSETATCSTIPRSTIEIVGISGSWTVRRTSMTAATSRPGAGVGATRGLTTWLPVPSGGPT